jgi:alkaline phosphatase D
VSTLRQPALGPIVGHTTHQSCRLWIAAEVPTREEGERRSLGVLGVVGPGGKVRQADLFYFRLRREYDRTGTFNLGVDVSLWQDDAMREKLKPFVLKPATSYRVRLAVLHLDDAYPDDSNVSSEQIASKLPPPRVWADKLNREPQEGIYAEAEFTTLPAPPALGSPAVAPLAFLFGSCRYPGLLWKRKEADRIFGPMRREACAEGTGRPPAQFTLMVGDQIYADMFNRHVPIGLADTYEEFQERYHTAFGSRNMREFLRRVPTYMILDDHEIEDNWTQDRLHRSHKSRQLFNLAIGAYMSYQWSHGPRFADSYVHGLPDDESPQLRRMEALQLHYDFAAAGYPFYVLDTRTQRYTQERGLQDNHLLGKPALDPSEPNQLDRLCAWLQHMQQLRGNTPKFIVSSSVFLPNGVDERDERGREASDTWPAFPHTRRALLDAIVRHEVQNVVFLSGDIHCSCVARLEFEGRGKSLTAYSIVSSAFYWPFAFADGDPAGYVHDSRDARTSDPFPLGNGLGLLHYRAWGFTQDDNYTRLDLDPATAELRVQMFDWDGLPIETRKQDGRFSSAAERLQLTAW